MDHTRTESDYYIGCMLGAAVGNAMGNCCRQEKALTHFTAPLHFDGLMQLALFTGEGLLRATHRAKMHGSNGTFAELLYESYQRWLRIQSVSYNDLVEIPENDGWLVRRSEMYYRGLPLIHTLKALKENKPGEIGHPSTDYADYEGMLRVIPVGLMFPGDEQVAFMVGAEACVLTHGTPDAYLSAGVYASLISRLADGDTLSAAVERSLEILSGHADSDRVRTAITDALYFLDDLKEMEEKDLPDAIDRFLMNLNASEAAPDLLTVGLLGAMLYPDDYKKAVLFGVRYKSAPHAAGMLAGSLCGLIKGENALLEEWLINLKHKDIVIQVAEDLLTGIKGGIFIVDREWVNKYPGW